MDLSGSSSTISPVTVSWTLLYYTLLDEVDLLSMYLDHFHVHIVNCNYQGNIMGLSVGQAHLLDTVISMVSLSLGVYTRVDNTVIIAGT